MNHLSILIAMMKYMDDLTPRVQESCAVPEATNPLAERNLLLEPRQQERRVLPPGLAKYEIAIKQRGLVPGGFESKKDDEQFSLRLSTPWTRILTKRLTNSFDRHHDARKKRT